MDWKSNMLRTLSEEIIKVLNSDKDIEYRVINNILISFNRINKYQKIDIYFSEMILDEFVFNTNIKNSRFSKHYDIEEFIYLNKKYYYLKIKELIKVNTLNDLELKLEEIKISHKKPSLLLHSCCGPCSSYVLEYLNDYFEITILYYNPNIDSLDEFELRLDNLYKIIKCLNLEINVLVPDFNHQTYLDYISGYELCNEGERRCYLCYEERMEVLAKIAKNKFDYFTTTLSISPYKNAKWLNEIGIRMQEKYQVNYLYANFKLNDGYKKSIELSKKYNLYRQDYCGCEYSKK